MDGLNNGHAPGHPRRRRTKIIGTLGPASSSLERVRALVDAGMDVARLNFSHGSHEEHASLYAAVRQASDESGRAVGVMADLQGPKIRLGRFEGGAAVLVPGSTFTVTTEPGPGTSERASVSYELSGRHGAQRSGFPPTATSWRSTRSTRTTSSRSASSTGCRRPRRRTTSTRMG